PAGGQRVELQLQVMLRGLRLEGALEVGIEPAAGALQLLDLGVQSVDAARDPLLLELEGGDLGVARGDGRVRRGELPGKAVAIGGERGPAAGYVRQAGGQVLSLF